MRVLLALAIVATLIIAIQADVYLHNPRGSNNRNRETSRQRANDNRMFDSENNNHGGYSWGPHLTYYEDSLLQIEWTSQHGCGAGHSKVDCEIVLQYMCHPTVRDGQTTNTISEDTMNERAVDPVTGENSYVYGMHEPFSNFDKCEKRDRNQGLWIADQNRNNNRGARVTRQDNGNNQYGFECAEERDYYPYWHPSPWRDIAVLTADASRCSYFKSESQNVKDKNECSQPKYNNEKECVDNGGSWNSVSSWGIDAPECIVNGFSRDNHLGNTKTGYTNSYGWVIPSLSNLRDNERDNGGDTATCVFRIRYNISTADVDGWRHVDRGDRMLDSDFNKEQSPVKTNPTVPFGSIGDKERHVRLAINTAQYGRTFQDRSYMFKIAKRPSNIAAGHRLFNLNVRGKRGNIVQVYPSVEYDFVPNDLRINAGDYVHFQWTGSDFNNGNNDGEGANGTDRSNIVQINDGRDNYPTPIDEQTLFPSREKALWMAHINQYGGKNCRTVDEQGCCYTEELQEVQAINDQDPRNCKYLNDPTAEYFDGGVVQMQKLGVFHYMSTRNNNFSNRSQKGKITVGTLLPVWAIVVASAAGIAFVVATVIAGGVYFAQTHPQSSVANIFGNARI